MRFGLAIAGLLASSCAALTPAYDSYDELPYSYQQERTIWGPRSGLELRVAELGAPRAGGALPVVLIHPWGLNMRAWADVAPALATERRVLLLDLPGHGKSSKLRTTQSMGRLAASVLDAMDAAGIERAVLMGNSLGGSVALEVSALASARVGALVLIAAPGGKHLPQPIRTAARQLARPGEIASLSGEAWWIGADLVGIGEGGLGRSVREDLVRLRGAREHPAFARESYHILVSVAEYAPAALADRPALVVHAADDLLIWKSTSQALADKLSGSRLVVLEDCGHLAELDCPDKLLGAVQPFLSALEQR